MRKKYPFPMKWGPLFLVICGSILTILDITRHILLDHGGVFWPQRSLAMYAMGGGLSTIGRACQITTIVGLCSFCAGIVWFMKLPEKLRDAFNGGQPKSEVAMA